MYRREKRLFMSMPMMQSWISNKMCIRDSDKHGVSLYIDEMINTPVGSRYVKSWNEDLKQLKHYRWVRNQIVHEPGCTETNMCNPVSYTHLCFPVCLHTFPTGNTTISK